MTCGHVPLVALFALVHVGVSRFVFVLGGRGRCDQRGIHDASFFQSQPAFAQVLADAGNDLLGKLVLLQQMAKAQDGALVWQASGAEVKLGILEVWPDKIIYPILDKPPNNFYFDNCQKFYVSLVTLRCPY